MALIAIQWSASALLLLVPRCYMHPRTADHTQSRCAHWSVLGAMSSAALHQVCLQCMELTALAARTELLQTAHQYLRTLRAAGHWTFNVIHYVRRRTNRNVLTFERAATRLTTEPMTSPSDTQRIDQRFRIPRCSL